MNNKELRRLWPEPPETAMERLVYALDQYDDEPSDRLVIATASLYEESVGLTFGDLREILRRLQA